MAINLLGPINQKPKQNKKSLKLVCCNRQQLKLSTCFKFIPKQPTEQKPPTLRINLAIGLEGIQDTAKKYYKNKKNIYIQKDDNDHFIPVPPSFVEILPLKIQKKSNKNFNCKRNNE